MVKKGSSYEKFVASVIEAMDDTVDVESGLWVEGPDGRRDMDVKVRGHVNGEEYSILVECKDYNPNTTGPVGIAYVDALDSKRQDLSMDAAMICSNSGYTAGALRKARRKGIGLISIIKAGDKRVKNEITEVFYKRKIKPGDLNISFRFKQEGPSELVLENVTFEGLKVVNWIYNQMFLIAFANPCESETFYSTYNFKVPTEIDFGGTPFEVIGIDFDFHVETQWFEDIHVIDASLGIYDYIRNKIKIGGSGPVQYSVRDVNPDELGAPIDFVPDEQDLGTGLLPGEVQVQIALYQSNIPDENEIPKLDELIVPEDLELKTKDTN